MYRSSSPRAVAVALIVASALFLTGCAKTVVGKWKSDLVTPLGSIPLTTDFKSDGTFTKTGTFQGKPVNATGTYKAEKDQLTITAQDVTVGGQSVAMLFPQLKTLFTQNGTFKFEGDNLIFSPDGRTETYTPVKE